MRILFVTYDSLSVGDGGARSAATVLGLADAGHQVDVLAARVELPAHDQVHLPESDGEAVRSFRSVRRTLFKLLLREKYDVVHAVDRSVLSAYWICRWRRTRLVYDAERCFSGKVGRPPNRFWRLFSTWLHRCEQRVLRHASVVIAGNDLLAADLKGLVSQTPVQLLGGVPLQPMVPSTGRSAMELLEFPVRPTHLVVVRMLSAARPQLRMVLMALRKVTDALPDVFCVIRGAADREAETLAAHLDIAGRCRFLEDREMAVYTACLEEADAALLMPGVGNRYPHPAVYALLHARAPLVAVQDSAHEALLEEAGAVMAVPSARSMAENLIRVLQEPLFSRTLPESERESVRKQYTYSSFKHALRMIYRNLPNKE